MARKPHEADDIQLEGGLLSSSPPRIESFSTEDDDYFTYQRESSRRAPSILSRLLGMTNVRRRGEYEHSAPLLEEPPTKQLPRETRTCRKGHVCGSLKRAVLALPFVALMLL